MHDTTTVVAQAAEEYRPGLFSAEALRPEIANRTKAGRMLTAGTNLFDELRRGRQLDRHILREVMTAAFDGRTDADGAWAWKDGYDAAEAGVVLFMREFGEKMIGPAARPVAAAKALERFQRIEALEPPETVRSETQIRLQQFSTPLPLAMLAARAADIQPGETVLEPSAGTGIIAAIAQIRLSGKAGGKLLLNEIGRVRAELLQLLFPETHVTSYDAESIGDYLPSAEADVIVMNPPFSRSPGSKGTVANADTRHVRAAYSMLRPGGRLVAITSEGCHPWDGEWEDLFKTATTPPEIAFTCGLDGNNFYQRHGTSFDCRLTVLDRPTGTQTRGSQIQRTNFARTASALLGALERGLDSRFKLGEPARKARSMDKAAKRRTAARTAKDKRDVAHNWGPYEQLNYKAVEQTCEEERDATPGAYQIWRSNTIRMPHATDHPTSLVQSRAMAAVRHPKPSYRPLLPLRVTEQGKLSDAQLESVVLAGQATDKHMQTRHLISQDWDVCIEVDNDGGAVDETTWNEAVESGKRFGDQTVQFRQGWMLGDGTGAGKGRQVAGILLDNWLRGRRRSLWLSQSDKLVEDARRDWIAVGGRPSDVINLTRIKPGEPVPAVQGVLFCTYSTLRSTSRQGNGTRLNQIIDWLADGPSEKNRHTFEGVIIFDESHAMAHAAGGKGNRGPVAPSAQGLAGLRLQNALPDARVVYVSATGATTIKGLAYATRLGLWSGGVTPFEGRDQFVDAMVKGGVAALEVVARDLKALGFYQARALAYEGVEIELVEHTLSKMQHGIYNEYADAFAIIHQNMNAVLEITGVVNPRGKTLNANAKAAARAAFESTKQRFFNHLLCSMKVPTLIKRMETDLKAQLAPVVQLVSTGEALMDRRLAKVPTSEWGDLSIDLTPREYVIEYLAHAFPTQLHKEITDPQTGAKSSVPEVDDDGNPVASQEACEARDTLIEHLAALPPVQAALDQLLHHFGHERVAEITGRTRRVLRIDDGKGVRLALHPRSNTSNLTETAAFMNGKKEILVFSRSGGIGRSYHADLDCRNRHRRTHYLLEAGWQADLAIQGLGRTHRTHQATAPIFRPISTNVKGERRFISTIARRLDSLGAITRGQRNSQTTMGAEDQALFKPADNFESQYALAALRQFFAHVTNGKVKGYNPEVLYEKTGLRIVDNEDNLLKDAAAHGAGAQPPARSANRGAELPLRQARADHRRQHRAGDRGRDVQPGSRGDQGRLDPVGEPRDAVHRRAHRRRNRAGGAEAARQDEAAHVPGGDQGSHQAGRRRPGIPAGRQPEVQARRTRGADGELVRRGG